MAKEERKVSSEKIKYSGVFDIEELFSLIKTWLKDEGFTNQIEASSNEHVEEDHRIISSEVKFSKTYSDDVKHDLSLAMEIKNVKDVVVEIDDKKRNMNTGDLELNIIGKIVTDFSNKRKEKLFGIEYLNHFFTLLLDKFFSEQYGTEHEDMIKEQLFQFSQVLTSFLHMQERYFGIANFN